jgi:glycerophosphoryl diester phosphodiesterase
MPTRRPQVVAHRGSSEAEPEHTLAAYEAAIEVGADALECDVRLTTDGHLVCMHDRRIDRTSSGTGRVSTLELAHLEGLDWGSWKKLAAADPLGEDPDDEEPDLVERSDRSKLLTLRRLCSMVADSSRPVGLAIETKHPTRHGGMVERTLVNLLNEFGWAAPRRGREPPVRVMSFSLLAMRRMRQLAPAVPLVFLMEYVPVPFRDGSLPRSVVAAGVRMSLLRTHPRYVEKVREQGRAVHVWTVDQPSDVRRCLDAGVEAIITNRPGAVLRQLDEELNGGVDAVVPRIAGPPLPGVGRQRRGRPEGQHRRRG